MKARKCKSKMPFRYRLQKVLDFRIRKKEEQLMVVQKAQQAVYEAEENIRRNEEEIEIVMNALAGYPTVTTSEFADKVEKILRNYKESEDNE